MRLRSIWRKLFCLTCALFGMQASAACLLPPVGVRLVDACYVELAIWSDARASITLWTPDEPWRGKYEAGEEGTGALVLVFKKGGVPKLIAQWCNEGCPFAPTPVVLQVGDRKVIWLEDPLAGDRHGASGDVIAVDADGSFRTLAKRQSLLNFSAGTEVVVKGNCKYVVPDAYFSAGVENNNVHQIPSGYVVIAHPQPIALNENCSKFTLLDPQTRPKDLLRLLRHFGVNRVERATHQGFLSFGDWFLRNGELYGKLNGGEVRLH